MLSSQDRRAFLKRARAHLKNRIASWEESQVSNVISDGRSLLVTMGSKMLWYRMQDDEWQLQREYPATCRFKQLHGEWVLFENGILFNLLTGREIHNVDHLFSSGWLCTHDDAWMAHDFDGNQLWEEVRSGEIIADFILIDGFMSPILGGKSHEIPSGSVVYAADSHDKFYTVTLCDGYLQLWEDTVLHRVKVEMPMRWYVSMGHLICVYDDHTVIVRLSNFSSCQLSAPGSLALMPNDYAFDRDRRQFIKLQFC